jgi:hypothetical protein
MWANLSCKRDVSLGGLTMWRDPDEKRDEEWEMLMLMLMLILSSMPAAVGF